MRIATVSDSAFKALEFEGLALRGCFVFLVEIGKDGKPGGKCMLIDYYSRKQVHVCRSTFAAELFAVIDAVGHALKIALCLTEVKNGKQGIKISGREWSS